MGGELERGDENENSGRKGLYNLTNRMSTQPNYYITGGAGFIGANLARFLNARGIIPYILEPLDRIGNKWKNLAGADFYLLDSSKGKYDYFNKFGDNQDFLIHLGANVTTTEEFNAGLWENNVKFSLDLFRAFHGKVIYASSASVYGNESQEFSEDRWDYLPQNPYAFTKYQLDKLVFRQKAIDTKVNDVCALRFFNVFGQGEGHKGSMSSVISKWLNDNKIGYDQGDGAIKIKLFKSLNPSYADGEQMRDFIHVSDICKVIWHATQGANFRAGIFNLGSGVASTWNTVAKNVLKARGLPDTLIEYVDMPDNLKNQYQYRTCADLTKLREVMKYTEPMTSIEEGIKLTWAEMNK